MLGEHGRSVNGRTGYAGAVDIERLAEDGWQRFRAIRLASLKEAPQAFGTSHAEASTWAEPLWRKQLRAFATFVAVVDGCDIAVVRGASETEYVDAAYLISMWVHPEHRRRGVASALIDAVAAWAAKRGCARVLLDVREHNEAAIATYREHGFRNTGVQHLDEGHVELQMGLELSPAGSSPRARRC